MNKNQVGELLDAIDSLYPGRIKIESAEQGKKRFMIFCKILEKHDVEAVNENLIVHAENSPHPPSVHDLVKSKVKSTVPDVNETNEYIQRFQNMPEQSEESKAAMEEAKAAIRKVLKFNDDESGDL